MEAESLIFDQNPWHILKKLDIYIIKKYLTTFFYAVMLVSLIAIVMNLSEYIDKFIRHGLSIKQVLLEYYIYFIPWINGEMWPLFAFLSVIFFTSRLARDSEIIAMLSTGMNYTRILRPMLIAGAFIAALHWYSENYVIPRSTHPMTEFQSKYIKKSIKTVLTNDVQFFINPQQKIYANSFSKRDSSLRTFRIESFDTSGVLLSLMKAQKLTYLKDSSKWRAKDYEIRTLDGENEYLTIGKGEEMDTTIAILPDDFIRHSKQMEIMTTPALKDFIQVEKSKGLDNTRDHYIEIYKRNAAPFTILILTIIGASIGTRKVRGGLGMHLAAGVTLGAVYVFISKFGEAFASNLDFAPALGVWMPNIVFGMLSIYLLSKAQK